MTYVWLGRLQVVIASSSSLAGLKSRVGFVFESWAFIMLIVSCVRRKGEGSTTNQSVVLAAPQWCSDLRGLYFSLALGRLSWSCKDLEHL